MGPGVMILRWRERERKSLEDFFLAAEFLQFCVLLIHWSCWVRREFGFLCLKILISAMVLHCVGGGGVAKRIQLLLRFPWLWQSLLPLLIIASLIILGGLFPFLLPCDIS
jgi:hypothetical protein